MYSVHTHTAAVFNDRYAPCSSAQYLVRPAVIVVLNGPDKIIKRAPIRRAPTPSSPLFHDPRRPASAIHYNTAPVLRFTLEIKTFKFITRECISTVEIYWLGVLSGG